MKWIIGVPSDLNYLHLYRDFAQTLQTVTPLNCSKLQMHQGKTFCTEYEKSKVLADKIALQAAAEGVPITIVYPGVIYGPGKLTTGNLVSRIV
jgi:nucleoside-diphosphate-sugar epimerase